MSADMDFFRLAFEERRKKLNNPLQWRDETARLFLSWYASQRHGLGELLEVDSQSTWDAATQWAFLFMMEEHRRTLNASLMADCMDMVRDELVEAGVIEESVAPMFVSHAVVAKLQSIQKEAAELAYKQGYEQGAADARDRPFPGSSSAEDLA